MSNLKSGLFVERMFGVTEHIYQAVPKGIGGLKRRERGILLQTLTSLTITSMHLTQHRVNLCALIGTVQDGGI